MARAVFESVGIICFFRKSFDLSKRELLLHHISEMLRPRKRRADAIERKFKAPTENTRMRGWVTT